MSSMSTPAICFVETDQEDVNSIRSMFPEATCIAATVSEADVPKECRDAEVLSCFVHSRVTSKTLEQLPKLKLLCTRSVGYDHIDVPACKQRGIAVCNVPDYGSHVIAEHVYALLLSTLRHVPEASKRVEGGTFDYRGLRGMSLRGKTIGIVGTGKIGRRVAQIAHGFGMNILLFDQCRVIELTDLLGARYVTFDELLASSDIITLHIPGTKTTEHMLNTDAFAKMKDGVVLVNTARGSLIHSQDLLKALDSGKVGYALLDVLEHETNFEENKKLVKHKRVITTPHIAFYADDSMKAMYSDCFQSIQQWIQGQQPAHTVKPVSIVCDLPGFARK